MAIKAPKGTKDVLPQESYKWHYIEQLVRQITSLAGYREIRTPVFEHTELFLRGVGDTTDIVQKEMYTFTDKGNRSVTLKPEGTAGVVRAFIAVSYTHLRSKAHRPDRTRKPRNISSALNWTKKARSFLRMQPQHF